ncbi:MAG: hypothetical protein ACREBY_12020 [Polaromonas sp.]
MRLFDFPRPFHPLALQLFLAGQVEWVFSGVDFGVFGQSDFNQRLVLFLAQHDAEAKRVGKVFDAGFESI